MSIGHFFISWRTGNSDPVMPLQWPGNLFSDRKMLAGRDMSYGSSCHHVLQPASHSRYYQHGSWPTFLLCLAWPQKPFQQCVLKTQELAWSTPGCQPHFEIKSLKGKAWIGAEVGVGRAPSLALGCSPPSLIPLALSFTSHGVC